MNLLHCSDSTYRNCFSKRINNNNDHNNNNNKLNLIDVSIPNDMNIVSKRIEKIEKCANLSIELKEIGA